MRDPLLLSSFHNSGSTAFLDMLCQHPQVHADGTSPLDAAYGSLRAAYSSSKEMVAFRHRNEEQADERIWQSARGWFEGFFEPLGLEEDTVVVDKGRRWVNHVDSFRKVWPESRLVYLVRNPLNCWASTVRQDLERNPFLTDGMGVPHEILVERFARYFKDTTDQNGPEGPLGYCLKRVESILNHGPARYPNVLFVTYESFCANPAAVMKKLCIDCGLDDFAGWDPEHVEAVTSVDIDANTNSKWNHPAMGSVSPVKMSKTNWRRMGAASEAQAISLARRYPLIFNRWGYADDLKALRRVS